jgi:multidrug efflux system membrane fusion protein
LIPQSAVQRGAPGTYVYLVNSDQTVSVRKITLGPGDANNIAVQQGIAAGNIVVVDGADRLKEGAKIAVRQGAGAQGHTTGQGQSQGSAPAQGQHQHRRGTNGQSTDQSHQSPSQ